MCRINDTPDFFFRRKMKTFACKDLGMDCDFVAKGETVEEVSRKAMEHGQKVHGEVLKKMTDTPEKAAELQQAMLQAIR
jgi:predicted small metal-binding protein